MSIWFSYQTFVLIYVPLSWPGKKLHVEGVCQILMSCGVIFGCVVFMIIVPTLIHTKFGRSAVINPDSRTFMLVDWKKMNFRTIIEWKINLGGISSGRVWCSDPHGQHLFTALNGEHFFGPWPLSRSRDAWWSASGKRNTLYRSLQKSWLQASKIDRAGEAPLDANLAIPNAVHLLRVQVSYMYR